MKKNKVVIVIIGILFTITAVIAAVHLTTRNAPLDGTLQVEVGNQIISLDLNKLELTPVQGSVVNGKGDEKSIDSQGETLSSVLVKAGITEYSQVDVVADDEYRVTVTAEEIAEAGRVYLLMENGEQPQLLVFGDPNSKRNVSNVIRLVIK